MSALMPDFDAYTDRQPIADHVENQVATQPDGEFRGTTSDMGPESIQHKGILSVLYRYANTRPLAVKVE